MGVVLYTLLCGHLPFGGTGLATNYEVAEDCKLYSSVKENILLNEKVISDSLSESAKELLTSMLRADPEQRISSSAIFTHPWMEHTAGEDEDLPNEDDAADIAGGGCSNGGGIMGSLRFASVKSSGTVLEADSSSRSLYSAASSSKSSKGSSKASAGSLNYFAKVARSAKDAMSKMKGALLQFLNHFLCITLSKHRIWCANTVRYRIFLFITHMHTIADIDTTLLQKSASEGALKGPNRKQSFSTATSGGSLGNGSGRRGVQVENDSDSERSAASRLSQFQSEKLVDSLDDNLRNSEHGTASQKSRSRKVSFSAGAQNQDQGAQSSSAPMSRLARVASKNVIDR
jgi:serine/threonine protein kinase